jgi:hypothetical protein
MADDRDEWYAPAWDNPVHAICDQCGEESECVLRTSPSDYVDKPASHWCRECWETACADR